MNLIDMFNQFALSHPWIPLALSIYLLVVKFIVGVRDATDKSPNTDDSWFERLATILKKTLGYMGGFRPSAPKGSTTAPGESIDAVGTKVK